MKILSISLFLAGGFLMPSVSQAQIPVTDGASIAQSITQQIETIAKWKLQYDQMVSQIEQMKQEYSALTGSRNLGEIFQNQALRDYLPGDWQGVYDAVKSGGYAGLSGTGKSVYDSNKLHDGCEYLPAGINRSVCEQRAVKGAQDKGFALDAYNAAKSRLSQIDQLMKTINTTQDPKAIAELQSRIGIEQASIQNEQTKLQMYSMVAAAEDRVQQQRQTELNAKANARRGWAKPAPVTFD